MEGPVSPTKKPRRESPPLLPFKQTVTAEQMLQQLRSNVHTVCGSRISHMTGSMLQQAAHKLARSVALKTLWVTLVRDAHSDLEWLQDCKVMDHRLLCCAREVLRCPVDIRGTHDHLYDMCTGNDAAPHLPAIVRRKVTSSFRTIRNDPRENVCFFCLKPLRDPFFPASYHIQCHRGICRVAFVCMLALEYAHASPKVEPVSGSMEAVLQRAITQTIAELSTLPRWDHQLHYVGFQL